MSNFPLEKFTIHKVRYTCGRSNKVFTADDTAEAIAYLSATAEKHEAQCKCIHRWTEWSTSNLGTWPDYEPFTSRTCKRCGKEEIL